MKPEELGAAAVSAILVGTDLTLHLPKGEKLPQGWPRGELLNVTETGRNMSFDPIKLLAYLQKLGKLSNIPKPNVPVEGRSQSVPSNAELDAKG